MKEIFNINEWQPGWRNFILKHGKTSEFKRFYKDLKKELDHCEKANITVYPPKDLVFNTFCSCALVDIKVVILGQDCYINSANIKDSCGKMISVPQAMGYAFSVPDGVTPPPSLRNIYKELLEDPDVDFKIPLNKNEKPNGNLTKWVTEENVFLFNCALTVVAHNSNSHAQYWEYFSDNLIKYISDNTENVVFLLLGSFAQNKTSLIDGHKHCIIKAGHPSPLNRTNPFVGSRVFSKTNIYLRSVGREEVNWNNL